MIKRTLELNPIVEDERIVNDFLKSLPRGGMKRTLVNLVLALKDIDRAAFHSSILSKTDRAFLDAYFGNVRKNSSTFTTTTEVKSDSSVLKESKKVEKNITNTGKVKGFK